DRDQKWRDDAGRNHLAALRQRLHHRPCEPIVDRSGPWHQAGKDNQHGQRSFHKTATQFNQMGNKGFFVASHVSSSCTQPYQPVRSALIEKKNAMHASWHPVDTLPLAQPQTSHANGAHAGACTKSAELKSGRASCVGNFWISRHFAPPTAARAMDEQIGRASCRERMDI